MSDVLKTETHDDRRIAFILSSSNDLLPDERGALVVLLNQRRFNAPELENCP